MTNLEKFRPTSALVSGWTLVAFLTGFIIETGIYGGNLLAVSATCATGILSSYLLFIKPYVLIFDEGIKIVNPTKNITASWDLVEEIETKFSMSVLIRGQVFYAWAAPAPGRSHSRRMHKSDFGPGLHVNARRLADSPGSDSGVCAYIARLRLEAFVPNGESTFAVERSYLYVYAIIGCAVISVLSFIL